MLDELFLRFLSIGDLGPIWSGSDQPPSSARNSGVMADLPDMTDI